MVARHEVRQRLGVGDDERQPGLEVLEQLVGQRHVVVGDPARERVDPDVGGAQERGDLVRTYRLEQVQPVADAEVPGELDETLDDLALGARHGDHGEVDVGQQGQRPHHRVDPACGRDASAVGEQRRLRGEADSGAHVAIGAQLGRRGGGVQHERRQRRQAVPALQLLRDEGRDGDDGVGVADVLGLGLRVGRDDALGLATVRRHPGHELVRVVDPRQLASGRLGARGGEGRHVDHVEVVRVDDVRREGVDHRTERELEVAQLWGDPAPAHPGAGRRPGLVPDLPADADDTVHAALNTRTHPHDGRLGVRSPVAQLRCRRTRAGVRPA